MSNICVSFSKQQHYKEKYKIKEKLKNYKHKYDESFEIKLCKPKIIAEWHQHDVVSEQRAGSRILLQQQLGHLLNVVRRDLDGANRVLRVFAAYFTEVEVEADMRMWAARVLDVVDVERLIMGEHVGCAVAIPRLPPNEVAVLFLGEPLLPRVMYPLNHRTGCTRGLEKVGYSTAMAERVDGPARLGCYVEICFQPLMT